MTFASVSPLRMDVESIWQVIETYTKVFSYLWQFPITYRVRSKKKRVELLPIRSYSYSAWKIYGCVIPFYLLTWVSTLIWINQTNSAHSLRIHQIVVICCGVVCLITLGSGFIGVALWRKVYVKMTNELTDDYNDLVQRKWGELSWGEIV